MVPILGARHLSTPSTATACCALIPREGGGGVNCATETVAVVAGSCDVDRQPIRFVAHTTLWHTYRLVWRLVYLFPCGCLAPCRGRGRGAGVYLHLRPGEHPRDTIVDCCPVHPGFLQLLHLCVASPVGAGNISLCMCRLLRSTSWLTDFGERRLGPVAPVCDQLDLSSLAVLVLVQSP